MDCVANAAKAFPATWQLLARSRLPSAASRALLPCSEDGQFNRVKIPRVCSPCATSPRPRRPSPPPPALHLPLRPALACNNARWRTLRAIQIGKSPNANVTPFPPVGDNPVLENGAQHLMRCNTESGMRSCKGDRVAISHEHLPRRPCVLMHKQLPTRSPCLCQHRWAGLSPSKTSSAPKTHTASDGFVHEKRSTLSSQRSRRSGLVVSTPGLQPGP